MTSLTPQERIATWRERGYLLDTPEGRVFVIDTGERGNATTSAGGTTTPPGARADRTALLADPAPPLLVLHGFPTSSHDFAAVLQALSADRRVVLFDQIGFGLSDKPDRRYGIHLHADTAQHVIDATGLDEFDLLTHDMGDSVGGELLARNLSGDLEVRVNKRVITNGSIYLDLAQLTIGQQLLMSLPDEITDEIPVENFMAGVTGTFAPDSSVDPTDTQVHGLLAATNGGLRLMARLIRYLEDRQREESRYTGAIEAHPSPLHIIWASLDPVAVATMAVRLRERRAARATELDAKLQTTFIELDGVGHYPMVEAPDRFAQAVVTALSTDRT